MRHYFAVPPGDDIEITFMYDGVPSVKRTYTAPPQIVAEVEAGQREPFWRDRERACQHVSVEGTEAAPCVRPHGHAGSHRADNGSIW